MGTVGLVLAVVVPMRSLIWRAMVRKACSTLLAFLAEVSRKGIPRLSANSYKFTSAMVLLWVVVAAEGEILVTGAFERSGA